MDDEPNPYAAPEAPLGEPAEISAELVEPLVFRGRLDETDVVEMQRCYDHLVIRRPVRVLVILVALLLAVSGVASVLLIGPHLATVAILVSCVGVVFGWQPLRTWQARRHYRRHAAQYLETQVSLSESRVSFENEAGKLEFGWNLVRVIVDTPAGLLFYKSARQELIWLPARLFEGNSRREQVVSLALRRGVSVRRMT